MTRRPPQETLPTPGAVHRRLPPRIATLGKAAALLRRAGYHVEKP